MLWKFYSGENNYRYAHITNATEMCNLQIIGKCKVRILQNNALLKISCCVETNFSWYKEKTTTNRVIHVPCAAMSRAFQRWTYWLRKNRPVPLRLLITYLYFGVGFLFLWPTGRCHWAATVLWSIFSSTLPRAPRGNEKRETPYPFPWRPNAMYLSSIQAASGMLGQSDIRRQGCREKTL